LACDVDGPHAGFVELDDLSVLLWGETSWRLWPNNTGALDMFCCRAAQEVAEPVNLCFPIAVPSQQAHRRRIALFRESIRIISCDRVDGETE
jgi:hypothetical protein